MIARQAHSLRIDIPKHFGNRSPDASPIGCKGLLSHDLWVMPEARERLRISMPGFLSVNCRNLPLGLGVEQPELDFFITVEFVGIFSLRIYTCHCAPNLLNFRWLSSLWFRNMHTL